MDTAELLMQGHLKVGFSPMSARKRASFGLLVWIFPRAKLAEKSTLTAVKRRRRDI